VTFYTICSLRTNLVFFYIFTNLTLALYCLAAAYWCLAEGKTAQGGNLTTVRTLLVLEHSSSKHMSLLLLWTAGDLVLHTDRMLTLRLIQAAASFVFSLCVAGWYLLFTMLLESVDFPLQLPVGDLSQRFKGASARRKKHEAGGTHEV
jgi:hypothetical protein